jgi:tryptophanyl-tRNA synthetase
VLDAVVAYLEPIQARYAELEADPAAVHEALALGAAKARAMAAPTMARVREVIGLLPTG